MGKEVTLFSSEERKSRAEVCTFLRNLADRLESGRVTLRQGGEELALDLPEKLVLEVKVEDEKKKSKGVQHSLEIELKWWPGIDSEGGAAGGVSLG